ncbi:GNAT family N-acetyltransferase [Actinoplanes sp. N902-109]|uniref:GNAT family N-acetyltransferase n=1 Tax=Actinoplanes sp. (strain N902-109) TaxID=649831 RepID=UPI0003294A05|nr:GNAT family protein [Actinoplanes sp. N902-109]AGL21020.1 putative acetyltransferase [Actinoplanes sp. N902-109]
MNPLISDRLRLRELRDEDLTDLVAWWQDPEVSISQGMGPLHPRPAAAIAEQFRAWCSNQGNDAGLVVTSREDGTVLGHVALFGATVHSRAATFAIMIGPPHQGRGYGTEATRLMLRYGFAELGLHRIQLGVMAYNERGIAAYKKAGFVEEGRAREAVHRNGTWYDQVHMGILAHEWQTTTSPTT